MIVFYHLCLIVITQTVQASAPKIGHVHYTTEDGLPHNAISNIIQDKQGYIWLATWDGLSRFDGYNFVNYRTSDEDRAPSLHNRINSILEDASGNIWALMYDEKLFRFNRTTERFESLLPPGSKKPDFRIKMLMQGNGMDIWAFTDQSDLIRIAVDSLNGNFTITEFPFPECTVSALHEDSYSNIWVGTNRGVAVLKSAGDSSSFVASEFLLDQHDVTAVFSAGGTVWFGTSDGTLYKYDLDQEQLSIQTPIRIKAPIVIMGISPDKEYLYLGTRNGGCLQLNLRNQECRRILSQKFSVQKLFVDSYGLVWMLTDHPGITKYDPSTGRTTEFTHKVTVPEYYRGIEKIVEHNGTLWAAMTGGGFGYYDRGTDRFEYFHNDPIHSPVVSNVVADFLIDSSHVIWMTTHERGLERITILEKTVDRTFAEPGSERVSDNEFRAFHLDRKGQLWAATKSGYLYLFDKNLQVLRRISSDDKGGALGYIYSIIQDCNGAFWLGTKGNGLFRMTMDEKEMLHFEHFMHDDSDPESLGHDMIYSILEDDAGHIWIGTYGGGVNLLQRDTTGEVRFLTPEHSLHGYPSDVCRKVRSLCQAPDGSIWAGTTEGTVQLVYDSKSHDVEAKIFRKEPGEKHSVLNNDIIDLFRDSKGNIWSATVGGGVVECTIEDNGQLHFKSYTTQEGMPSNDVRSITEDQFGNIWIGTDHHICMLNPDNGTLSVFSNYEGVGNTMLSETTALALDDERVIFGSIDGIYIIDTRYFSEDPGDPIRLEITDIQFNDQRISPQGGFIRQSSVSGIESVTLPDRHVVFGFSFTSLNYAVQHRIHYRYKLEGYDKEWKNDNGERHAVYASVPHGKYCFRVQAFFPGTPDHYEEDSIQVVVPPFFWETKMAIGFYFLFIILVVVGMILVVHRKRLLIHGMRVFKIGPSEIVLNDENDQKFLSGIMKWLEQHYTNPNLIIDDMVTPSGMSRSSFYNRLKLLVQMSPLELLNDFRIKKAEMYLKDSDLSIAEIAYRVGFNDPSYFTRLFKAREGVTPTVYRKIASEGNQKTD